MAKNRALSDLARRFPENGVKRLSHPHDSVRDTPRLASRATSWFPDLDRLVFEETTVPPGGFMRERFAHALEDHCVRMPFRLGDASELAAAKQGGLKQVAGKRGGGVLRAAAAPCCRRAFLLDALLAGCRAVFVTRNGIGLAGAAALATAFGRRSATWYHPRKVWAVAPVSGGAEVGRWPIPSTCESWSKGLAWSTSGVRRPRTTASI